MPAGRNRKGDAHTPSFDMRRTADAERGALHLQERAGEDDAQPAPGRHKASLVVPFLPLAVAYPLTGLHRNLNVACAGGVAAHGRDHPAWTRAGHCLSQQVLQGQAGGLLVAFDLNGGAILQVEPGIRPGHAQGDPRVLQQGRGGPPLASLGTPVDHQR
jgi:hypothetical protein